MKQIGFRRAVVILLTVLTSLLVLDLFVFNALILPLMQKVLDEACRGETMPFVNQLFQTAVPNATQICLIDYQYKLTYAYKALRIPLMSLAVGATLFSWHISRRQDLKASVRATPRRLAVVMTWILATVILVYVQLGSYMRYVADDYCMAAETVNRGVIGATMYWYNTRISRYSTNLILSIEGALGPQFASLYTALILIAMIASTAFVIYQWILDKPKPGRLQFSILLSAMVIFATLQTALDLPQSLYWSSAMANMLPPLVLLAICGGIILRGITHERPTGFGLKWFILTGFLALVAGGFSEAFTVMQVGLWGLVLLIKFLVRGLKDPRDVQGMAAALLIGSLAALAVHLAAPGFEGRLERDYLTIERSILSAFPIALTSALEWLRWAFSSLHRSLSLLALLLICFLASLRFFGNQLRSIDPPRLGWWALISLPPAAFALVYACFIPGAYAYGGPPPGRHLIIPAYILALAVGLFGALLGQLLVKDDRPKLMQAYRTLGILALALLLVTSVQAIRSQLRLLYSFARYQEAWDANEVLIQAAIDHGADQVTIPAMPVQWWNVDNREIGPDPEDHINRCAGRYYGIEIRAVEPPSQ